MNSTQLDEANRIIESLRAKYEQDESDTKRTADRKPWCVPIRVQILEPCDKGGVPREIEVATHDLSTRGFSFVTQYYVHNGGRVITTFEAISQKPTIIGVVRNCIHLGGALHRVGVEFTEIRKQL